LSLCQCGCGQPANPGRRFILKHQPLRAANRLWRGGVKVRRGYRAIYLPDHPKAIGKYVYEHVLIVEKAMGKPLRDGAEVHHVDKDRQNNSHSNLVACDSHAYHFLLHQRGDALSACGNANALRCRYCHKYDRQEDMSGNRKHPYHRSCVTRSAVRERRRCHADN